MEVKDNRPPQFLVPNKTLKTRVAEALEISWELITSRITEYRLEYAERISRIIGRPRPTIHQSISLGEVHGPYQGHPLAGKAADLDYVGTFFYEDLHRHSAPLTFESWRASIESNDSRLLKLMEPHIEEVYCRSKANFIGAELIASGVWSFGKWNTCLLAQLEPRERKMIAPFSKQIYQQVKRILEKSTGVRRGIRVNAKQRLIILAGLALILLMLLIPPWRSSGGYPKGYRLIFAPPPSATSIDLPRLFVQGVFIVLLTGGIVFMLQGREK
jgi:hypothetical protein